MLVFERVRVVLVLVLLLLMLVLVLRLVSGVAAGLLLLLLLLVLVLMLVLVLLVLVLSTGGSQAADLHPSRCEGVAGTVDPICDCLPQPLNLQAYRNHARLPYGVLCSSQQVPALIAAASSRPASAAAAVHWRCKTSGVRLRPRYCRDRLLCIHSEYFTRDSRLICVLCVSPSIYSTFPLLHLFHAVRF